MKAIIEWMNKDHHYMCRSEQGYQIGKPLTIGNPFGIRIVRKDGSVVQDFTDAVNDSFEEIRVTIVHTDEDYVSTSEIIQPPKTYSFSERVYLALTLMYSGRLS